MVLLKQVDDRGLIFFTNYESKKVRGECDHGGDVVMLKLPRCIFRRVLCRERISQAIHLLPLSSIGRKYIDKFEWREK